MSLFSVVKLHISESVTPKCVNREQSEVCIVSDAGLL